MTMAATLTEAAHLSYAQCYILWEAETLKAKLAAFNAAAALAFSDDVPNDRPVGNWLVLLVGLQSQMPEGLLPQPMFNAAADYLFRMCIAAANMRVNGLISNASVVALLAAWNAQIGT